MEITKLTEPKLVYPEFKYFKSIYTQINIANEVYLSGEDDLVRLYFSKDSDFYLISGKITAETEFCRWLKKYGKTIKASLEDLILIGKTLKKNAASIEYTENYFKFSIINSDSCETTDILFKEEELPKELKSQIKNFSKKLSVEEELTESYFLDDICTVYLDTSKKITQNRTSVKIIDIPTARIKSLIKDSKKELLFSEIQENGQRFVAIKSSNEELQLELEQFFITI